MPKKTQKKRSPTSPQVGRRWVKVVGSDFHYEWPQRQVFSKGFKTWHYTDDKSQKPKRIKSPATILEDNGDGTFTAWSYGVWGPVGTHGKLKPGIQVTAHFTRDDVAVVARIEGLIARSLRSQQALFEVMKLNRDLADKSARKNGRP